MSTENTPDDTAPSVREMYRQLETPQGAQLERCPICEAEAAPWQFSASRDAPIQRVVMCSHGDEIGPQDGIANSGCLLYMPGNAFYQPTAREAIRYWNGFATALRELRAGNAPAAAPVAQPAAESKAFRHEPLTDQFVQLVPDQCDRIVWRGNYYHLPLGAAAAAQPAQQPLTEAQLMCCITDAGCIGTVKMSFESGPYDIDRPTLNATKLARAIECAHGIGTAGVPVDTTGAS